MASIDIESGSSKTLTMRPLGTLERWFTLMDEHRSNHFSMVAEVVGHAHPGQWRSALDQLQRRHPMLRVSIRWTDSGECHFVQCDASIALNIVKRSSSGQWKDEAVRQLQTRFDIAAGPLIRVLLLVGEERCDVVITVHHAIADGLSVSCLMGDLLDAASGFQIDRLALPASQEEQLELRKRLGNTNPHVVGETVAAPIPKRFGFRSEFDQEASIDSVRLGVYETSRLIIKARDERTTVHAAILAALVLAGRKISTSWANDAVEGFTPISLRTRLGLDAHCVVALSASGTLLDPRPNANLWDIAREAKEQLRSQETMQGIEKTLNYFDLVTANDAKSASVAQAAANAIGFKLMLTNLGKLSFATEARGLTLEALWGPIINLGFEDEQTVSAATVNGSLFLTHTAITPIRLLLRHAVTLLVQACDTPTS